MSAKFLHTFSEENSELQKQIGCMTGIFQMFDRHNLLGGRRFKGRNNKKITSENSSVNVSNPGADNVACSHQLVLEKNLSENQRMSLESSRTSFSSSTSSSFSSIDCNKSTLHGPTSFNQATFHDKAVKNSPKSVNQEPQNLSVKTSYKEEFKKPVLSYIDSPRPMQLSKSVDGSYVIGGIEGKKSRSPLELNESIRVLMKLREAPWTFEAKETVLNRRFSYDGREISTNFLDSRENGKSTSKLKELPRLSLDSRESSMKSSNSVTKDLDRSRSNKEKNFTYSIGQKEFVSKKSAPGVVAKLMGLEAMPTLCSNLEEQVDVINNYALNTSKNVQPPSDSPRSSEKDLNKHGVKNPVVISKAYFTAKTTIEPAPWKKQQKEKLHVTQNKLKQQPETVYSEIEKRLKDLEFHHANKDLRALKQILDAIQAKGLLESKKNEQQRSPKFVSTKSDENLSSPIARKPPLPASTKRISTKKAYDSPIVIMKPAKSLNRFDVAATSIIHLHGLGNIQRLRSSVVMDKKKDPCSSKLARDCSPRACLIIKGKTEENCQKSQLRTELSLSKPQQSSRENNEKSSNSVSPRLHQRKLEVESRIRSSVPSSDSRKNQNLSTNKQPSESVSPRNKLRRRPTTSQQGDEMPRRSDSNMSSASQLSMEDTLPKNFTSPEQGAQKNLSVGLDEEASSLALAAVAAEQPSPISVLDATFYQDEVPSVVMKRSTNISKGNKLLSSDKFCEPQEIDSEINVKKLESIGKLLQKLEELNSTTETTSNTDHIASLCETPRNPNHRYISEILLASGLLMTGLSSSPTDLMPSQFHPTGHPLNPDLFLVLEQTKSSQESKSENMNENTLLRRNFNVEKLQRKLLFDVVNEVLGQKLELTCLSSHPVLLSARKLQGRLPSGQQLLKQLCSEIDQLHAEALKAEDPGDDGSNIIDEEILRQPPLDWNDFRREFSGIVLDIERLIFKDMIDEVVCGEADSLKYKSSRRRRQLFAK